MGHKIQSSCVENSQLGPYVHRDLSLVNLHQVYNREVSTGDVQIYINRMVSKLCESVFHRSLQGKKNNN